MMIIVLASSLFISMATNVQVFAMSAKEVAKRSDDLYRQAVMETAEVEMITTSGERDRQVSFEYYAYYSAKRQDKTSVKFSNGRAILIEWSEGDVDYYYKKSKRNRKMRRINIGDGKYVQGSLLSFEDVQNLGRAEIDDFEYTFLQADQFAYRIVATPKEGVESSYQKRVIDLDENFVVRRIEFYHGSKDKPELLKVLENVDVELAKNGRWRAIKSVITSDFLGKETVLSVKRRNFLSKPEMKYFSNNFLLR